MRGSPLLHDPKFQDVAETRAFLSKGSSRGEATASRDARDV
jgi:hypothetical protein